MEAPTSVCTRSDEPALDLDFINQAMTFTPSERCTVSCGTVCVDPHESKVLIIFNRRLKIWQLPKGRKNIGEDLHTAALRETFEETGVRATLLSLKIRTRSTNPAGAIHDAISGGPRGRITGTGTAMLDSENSDGGKRRSPSRRGIASSTALESNHTHHTTDHANTNGGSSSGSVVFAAATAVAVAAAADPKVTCNLFNNELVGLVQYPDLQVVTPNTMKTVFFYAAAADSTAPIGPGAQEDHEDLAAEWVDFQEADQRLRFRSEREALWKVKRDMKRSGKSE